VASTFYLSPFASFLQLLNDSGNVNPNLLMWTYAAGTSTPTATYTDITGGTPNSNPIQLLSNGRLPNVSVWQQGGVPIKIQFSTNAGTVGAPVFGVQIGPTFDQVTGINDPGALLTTLINPASGSGADLIANGVRSYDLMATVRAANVPSLAAGQTLIIDVEGGLVVNDQASGQFYWNATSTAVDDGINVIKPTAAGSTGRYLRLLNSPTYGSFTATAVGLTTAPTATFYYAVAGNMVTLFAGGTVTGTSNSTSFSLSGLPALITPTRTQTPYAAQTGFSDNSASCWAAVQINTTGTIAFLHFAAYGNPPALTGWTASGSKGSGGFSVPYLLN
jgi:hypothetical protein